MADNNRTVWVLPPFVKVSKRHLHLCLTFLLCDDVFPSVSSSPVSVLSPLNNSQPDIPSKSVTERLGTDCKVKNQPRNMQRKLHLKRQMVSILVIGFVLDVKNDDVILGTTGKEVLSY